MSGQDGWHAGRRGSAPARRCKPQQVMQAGGLPACPLQQLPCLATLAASDGDAVQIHPDNLGFCNRGAARRGAGLLCDATPSCPRRGTPLPHSWPPLSCDLRIHPTLRVCSPQRRNRSAWGLRERKDSVGTEVGKNRWCRGSTLAFCARTPLCPPAVPSATPQAACKRACSCGAAQRHQRYHRHQWPAGAAASPANR